MANNPASLRTARARVLGLGASGSGTEHFWRHRMTAISNAVLVPAFVFIFALGFGRDFESASALVSKPIVAIVLILFILSISVHMRLGLLTVIEDYVHAKGWKMTAVILNTFFAFAIAVAAIFAVLRVSFGVGF
jgi:succinate dehydrogenase / fumarate reductase membrane anchor subunit